MCRVKELGVLNWDFGVCGSELECRVRDKGQGQVTE